MPSAAHEVLVAALGDRPELVASVLETLVGRRPGVPLVRVDSTLRFVDPEEVRPDLVLRFLDRRLRDRGPLSWGRGCMDPKAVPAAVVASERVKVSPDREAELLQANEDFERGDYIELTPEQLARGIERGESPWPDESRG